MQMQNSRTAILSHEPPRLNPQLDRPALAEEYRRRGRIHIQSVLTQASAERLYFCLRDETTYSLCVNSGADTRTLRDLTSQQRLDYATAAWRQVGEYADAQATLYRSGHFLTAHDDNTPGTKRLAAYVLSFTPVWRPEWGGLLEFLDDTSQVETGYVPGFNTIKLFRVPMTHYVSMVAPSAMSGRYSITGWLRAR
jgi:Rps23 Pro-64 3,4-dihydroxylase Tpa1-like proline 4-hydroxylase